MDFAKVDENFKINSKIEKDDIKFYSIDEKPFKIYGVFRENDKYVRMPGEVAKKVSNGVFSLYHKTAGGRVKFKTNSSYVAIYAKITPCCLSHMALTGSSGFDLYADGVFVKTFVPPFDIYWTDRIFEDIITLPENKMHEISINFPLYGSVEELHIGLQETADLCETSGYKNEKPIVYYGSSITQGGCASRPGTCYQAIVSRVFDCNYINLGFSGNAKGEVEMAEYIAGLDMSMFVYDYDYNAPDEEHLEQTHERMFKIIREKHPDIPIIMMSKPVFVYNETNLKRRNIVEVTYKNALANGDNNVYFLDGKALMKECENEGTVDGAHPTDFGFASMAHALIKVMENIDF